MADRWSLRWPAAGIVVARARTTWSPGLVIRRLPGWADSASDTIVTVRRRAWGQIWRFRRRVPLLHPAPERFDHGEQHSQDGSQQERDSRRQVPASAEVADVHALARLARTSPGLQGPSYLPTSCARGISLPTLPVRPRARGGTARRRPSGRGRRRPAAGRGCDLAGRAIWSLPAGSVSSSGLPSPDPPRLRG